MAVHDRQRVQNEIMCATPAGSGGVRIPRASSWVRAAGWDQVLRLLCGGLGVAGEVPSGPAIVVANHSSHADTAALLAVLGKRAPVLVVAGGDYWTGWRERLARDVVGILPIARDGGFEALLDVAGAHLRAGGVVVLYPEGTRTADGTIGRFHAGAARLASATGVPIVPMGLRGTRELYGKGHRLPHLSSTRTAPLGIRIGDPVHVAPDADADQVRAISTELRTTVESLVRPPAGVKVPWPLTTPEMHDGYGGVLAGSAVGVAIGLELVVRSWKRHR